MQKFKEWFGASAGLSIGIVFGVVVLCALCGAACFIFATLGAIIPTPVP